MTDNPSLADSIKHSICKNGFPEKVVRLPFKPVYESSKRHDVSLKEVWEGLKKEQIFGRIQGDHIEFRSSVKPPEPTPQSSTAFPGAPDFNNPEDLQKAAQEFMAQMDPQQREEMRKKVDAMSEEEKKEMIDMISKDFKTGS